MNENLFLFIGLICLLVFLYLLDFWYPDSEARESGSETHARARYSVAEKIQKDFDQ